MSKNCVQYSLKPIQMKQIFPPISILSSLNTTTLVYITGKAYNDDQLKPQTKITQAKKACKHECLGQDILTEAYEHAQVGFRMFLPARMTSSTNSSCDAITGLNNKEPLIISQTKRQDNIDDNIFFAPSILSINYDGKN